MADSTSCKTSTQFLSMDLHSRRPPKPTTNISKSKPLFHILCKSFLFLLFLVAIPLFPSQAPNFINQSLLNKFWELFHLLFIGLAVSYGLFCRRNGGLDIDQSSNFDESHSSFVSRIFHVCPIFEEGYENSCGIDGKTGYQSWYAHGNYYKDENLHAVNNGRFFGDEQVNCKDRSLGSEGDFEISFEDVEKSQVFQAWNSKYFQGESMVVMSEASYELGGYGESGPVVGYKSLGLPVRSLNSGIASPVSPHFSDGGGSISSFKEGSSSSSERKLSGKEFVDMGPENLERNFDETVVLTSQIPWHLRSGRVEFTEEVGSGGSLPSRLRRPSVDETESESLKSQSFQSTVSLSSQASSVSHSPTRLSPSSSISSEANSEAEESGKSKSFRASYPPVSPSPFKTINGEAPLNAFHLRRYSSGSLFQKDSEKSLKSKLKELHGNKREEPLGSQEREQGSVKLDKKPETPVKVSSRAKSVRTVRTSRYAAEASKAGDTIKREADYDMGRSPDEANAAKVVKDEVKRGPAHLSNETTNRNLDPWLHIPKPAYEQYQKKEKKDFFENVTVESEQDSKSEPENFELISDENACSQTVRDAGYESSEVDRKAGEFIAKFREQIRLQKVASMDRSRGMRISGNHFR